MKTTSIVARSAMTCFFCSMALISCKPTVKVEAPEKPITINMNIKIDHEIRVKLDKDIENVLDERKDIF